MAQIFPNLRAEMTRNGLKVEDLAETLGTSRRNVANRLNGSTQITIAECKTIRNSLFPELTIDYLFDPEPRTGE